MNDSIPTIVCHRCAAVNRVPAHRLGDHPVCGKCQAGLVPGHPVELDDSTFSKFIQRTSLPVVVDFWAEWCGPCKRMAPEFSAAAARLAPDFILAKLDTESARQTASQFGISGIPCLIVFVKGQEVARQEGAMSRDQIVQWVRLVRR